MTYGDYSAIDAVNWSTLQNMRDSALHYRYRLGAPREDTAALALGRVTHALVFEPDTFARDFAIYEGGDRRGKAWEAFKAEHTGMTIFKPNEVDAAVAMAEAVRRHPLVQPYLGGGAFEQTITWTDRETGLRCKARPDWTVAQTRVLLDLKTTRCADGRRFGASAARYGYHCQLAHYAMGVEAALGWKPWRVLLVAVESMAPHDLSVFELDNDVLYAGREEVLSLLIKLSYHRESDTWPGRYEEEQALQLPAWIFGDEDGDENPADLGLTFGSEP